MLGYQPEEIVTSEPTRSARYKWAIVVDTTVPAGLMANAVDDYLGELAGTKPEDLGVSAFSVFGPRNRVDKLVKKLALL